MKGQTSLLQDAKRAPYREWKVRLPFEATITVPRGTYRVEVGKVGMKFLGWVVD